MRLGQLCYSSGNNVHARRRWPARVFARTPTGGHPRELSEGLLLLHLAVLLRCSVCAVCGLTSASIRIAAILNATSTCILDRHRRLRDWEISGLDLNRECTGRGRGLI